MQIKVHSLNWTCCRTERTLLEMKASFTRKTRGEVLRLALGTPRDRQEWQVLEKNPMLRC